MNSIASVSNELMEQPLVYVLFAMQTWHLNQFVVMIVLHMQISALWKDSLVLRRKS